MVGRLRRLPDALKADPEIVMAAVQQEGATLQWASDELKNDPEIVMAAGSAAWGGA